MNRSFFLATVAIVTLATPAFADCVLKSEPAQSVPGCNVANGYSDGVRVGNFRADGKVVGLTKACTADDRFHNTVGRISPPNKVVWAGTTYVLSGDCRSSSKN